MPHHALAFDTHLYVKKLTKAGLSSEQAEAQAEALAQIVDVNLATKHDITSLKRDMKEIEASLKRDMKELELGLEKKILESKAEIIKWCVGAVFASVGLFATIIGQLQPLS